MKTSGVMIAIGYGMLPVPIAVVLWYVYALAWHGDAPIIEFIAIVLPGYLFMGIQSICYAVFMSKVHHRWQLTKRISLSGFLGFACGMTLMVFEVDFGMFMAVIGLIAGIIVPLIMSRFELLECEQ